MDEIVKEPIVVKPTVGLVQGAGVSELLVRQSDDVVLRYTVRVEEIRLDELSARMAAANERLAAIPHMPTNEELLEWAREHYPMMDYSAERVELERIVAEGAEILGRVK